MSPSVKDVLGYEPDEIIGRIYTEFLDPESPFNADVGICESQRFDAGQDDHHQVLRVVATQDGNLKVLRVQTYGLRNEDGKVSINHGIAQDVTEAYFREKKLYKRMANLSGINSRLTEREKFVLESIIAGKLNKVIARGAFGAQMNFWKQRMESADIADVYYPAFLTLAPNWRYAYHH